MATMLIIGMGPKKGPKHMNPMEKYLSKGAENSDKEPLIEDEASSKSTGKISFSMPAGFKVPDGVKDGESFDAMATLAVKDGKLVLSELDGAPVGDEAEEMDEAEEQPADSEEPAAEEEPAPDSEPSDEEDKDLGFLDMIEKKSKKFKK
jgi:hypothetical protein